MLRATKSYHTYQVYIHPNLLALLQEPHSNVAFLENGSPLQINLQAKSIIAIGMRGVVHCTRIGSHDGGPKRWWPGGSI